MSSRIVGVDVECKVGNELVVGKKMAPWWWG